MRDHRPPFTLPKPEPVRYDDDGIPNLRELIYSLLVAGVPAVIALWLLGVVPL